MPREGPADYFQAVIWLVELGRPELAKPILDELTKLNVTDAQRIALVENFGSHSMLQLARTKELAPEGVKFADACMAAAAAAANDPKRIARLVAAAADPSPEVRTVARNDLAATGQTGATAVLEALAKETDHSRRAALLTAAAHIRPFVVGPLLAMLETGDPTLRADVAALLSKLNVPQSVPLILASRDASERALRSALDHFRQGVPPFAVDEADQVELWTWSDPQKRLAARRYPADEAKTIWMARLAIKLAQLRPENPQYRRDAIVLGLQANESLNAYGERQSAASPFSFLEQAAGFAVAADTATLNHALKFALTQRHARAAAALIVELRIRGDVTVLATRDGQPSPLADALVHPNRGVRFAALRTIMSLDPKSPYPGSSRVPESLAWFAGGTGDHTALVAMPTNLAASDVAGMLTAHGLDAEATNRGRDAVSLARQMADLEMILVDTDIRAPNIREVLYELRVSPTTGEIPIGLLAPEGQLEMAERLAEEHERVFAVSRPHSAEVLARVVEQVSSMAPRNSVPAEGRATEAVEAVAWLAKLASGERPFYKIRRTEPIIQAALYHANAAQSAIAALERLGTPASQRALISYASQPALPLAGRTQAAAAFRDSVAAHGVLLTNEEILAQYDLYNASATLDAQTQQVLGALLDTIESRRGAQSPAPLPMP
jgi:hypothetical protein